MQDLISGFRELINQYGLPIVTVCGMGYFIYFVWKFVTDNISTQLAETKKSVIVLIDKIRMLDNDLIRLEQKLNTALELERQKKEQEKSKQE